MNRLLLLVFCIFSLSTSEVFNITKFDVDYRHGFSMQFGYLLDNFEDNKIVSNVTYYNDSNIVHPRIGVSVPFGINLTTTPMIGLKYDIYGKGTHYGVVNLNYTMNFNKIIHEGYNEFSNAFENPNRYFEVIYNVLYKKNRHFHVGTQAESYIDISEDSQIPIDRITFGIGSIMKIFYNDTINSMIFFGVDLENNFNFISKYSVLYVY